MKTLRQILAIARTEFRFGLRRGAPVVVTAVIGLLLGAGVPWGLVVFYAKLSLLDGLPVLAFATLIGILAGAASRSRRAALLPGFAAGMAGIFFWLWAFRAPDASGNTYDLLAYHLFQDYSSIWRAAFDRMVRVLPEPLASGLSGVGTTPVGTGQTAGMALAALLALAGAAFLARLWLQWKENF